MHMASKIEGLKKKYMLVVVNRGTKHNCLFNLLILFANYFLTLLFSLI
jgi:hypothetical protein